MNGIIYWGVFFEWPQIRQATAALQREPLEREIAFPHITFAFRPQHIDTSLWGQSLTCYITGYGRDAENEGLSVQLPADDPRVCAAYTGAAVPHITLSVSRWGKPVNTVRLAFSPLPSAIPLTGVFGCYSDNGQVLLTPL